MISKIAEALGLKNNPVAILWSDEAPESAVQFKAGRWGCVMSMMAAAAAQGKTAVFDRTTYGCWGGGVGLGFGNAYEVFPGGIEGFCSFLSDGNEKTETGRAIGEAMAQNPGGARMAPDFLHGERYVKDPETTRRFMAALPIQEIPARYVVVKPLSAVSPTEEPQSVTFFVAPHALSALVVLANHLHPERENVGIPYAAACQVMGILSYREAQKEHPRALVGLSDLSARRTVRPLLGDNALSFTAPWRLFQQMEDSVEGSFLGNELWEGLRERVE